MAIFAKKMTFTRQKNVVKSIGNYTSNETIKINVVCKNEMEEFAKIYRRCEQSSILAYSN